MEPGPTPIAQTAIREVLDDFRAALDAEEALASVSLAQDNLGIMLRAAVNEFDWYLYNFRRNAPHSTTVEEHFYLMQLGINRMIKLALESRPAFDVPIIMFPRDRELTIKALTFVSRLGCIEHGRRVADSVGTGLGTIRKVRDALFEFDIPRAVVDDEYHERGLREHYDRELEKLSALQADREHDAKVLKRVNTLLTENVRVFHGCFIGYDSDPFLDDHFFIEGFKYLRRQEGYDSFHHSLEFGGVRFQKYFLALAYFTGLALKHEAFCEALIKKAPDIKLFNILTISYESQPFIDDIQRALNSFGMMFGNFTITTEQEADTIFRVLSVSRGRTSLLSRPASPIPSNIQVSDTGFIRSIGGAQMSPVAFLLSSLRENFPADYNRNQRTRENSMQRAMKRVLAERFHGLIYRQNIKLARDGKILTDVDFVIGDPAQGTLVLCQLKSQDLYGADIRARGTRTGRLNREVSKWLASVREWIGSDDARRIRSAFRLEKSFVAKQIFYLTVSRHYAHSLRKADLGENAPFATWLQFVNAVELMRQQQGDFRTIAGLCRLLIKQSFDIPEGHHVQEEDDRAFKLDTIEFVVRRVA